MSDNEKYISFLNKYFVFKKIRNVDAKSVKIEMLDEMTESSEIEQTEKSKKNSKKGKKVRLVE